VEVDASDETGPLLRAAGRLLLPLPGAPLAALSRSEAVFPFTGLCAAMRLVEVRSAVLLAVSYWEGSGLEQYGARGRPPIGMLLRGVKLYLGPPQVETGSGRRKRALFPGEYT
jgi:hypothetical protein